MSWHHAWRELWRHPARTGLSLLGIAVATALLLDMVMLSGGIERSFSRLLLSRGFQVRVSPAGTMPFDTDAMLDHVAELLATIRGNQDVLAAGAVLGTSAYGRVGAVRVPLVVYGVTPAAQGMYQLERGRDLVPGDTGGVLVGAPSAARLGVRVGDAVTLVGRLDPRKADAAVERTLIVRGVARFVYDARQQPSVAVPLGTAQQLAGANATDRASLLMLRIRDGTNVDSATRRLRRQLPGVSVNSIGDVMVQFRLRLSYFRQMSLILGSIALVVTVLLIGTLLAITVNERIGEIAALRAIGVARASVVRQVFLEGLLLTVIGGGVGVLLGIGTARWLDAILTAFPGLPAAISFFVADPAQLTRGALVLIATGLCAGLVPAWRAATLPIAATLRGDAP